MPVFFMINNQQNYDKSKLIIMPIMIQKKRGRGKLHTVQHKRNAHPLAYVRGSLPSVARYPQPLQM